MSTEERLENLENELARRKQRGRWLAAAVVVAVAATVCLGLAHQDQNRTIRAGAFVLLDEKGQVRGRLAGLGDGPGLSLYDETGRTRAIITVSKDDSWLTLFDAKGNRGVKMAVTPLGPYQSGSWIRLCDDSGDPRALLCVTGAESRYPGEAFLTLFDENGGRGAKIAATRRGPWVRLCDESGKPVWSAP